MTDNTARPLRLIFIVLIIALLTAGVLLLKQRANMSRIEQEKHALQQKIESLLASDSTATSTPAESNTPVPAASIQPPTSIPAVSSPEPTLTLEQASVTATNGILRATLLFKTDSTNDLGELFVVARLPDNAGTRIHEILLAPSDIYKEFNKRISDDGKFSAFRTQSGRTNQVEVAFEVTGPSTLDVRGTLGIGPFDLAITPDQAIATPKQ